MDNVVGVDNALAVLGLGQSKVVARQATEHSCSPYKAHPCSHAESISDIAIHVEHKGINKDEPADFAAGDAQCCQIHTSACNGQESSAV